MSFPGILFLGRCFSGRIFFRKFICFLSYNSIELGVGDLMTHNGGNVDNFIKREFNGSAE